MWGRYGYEKEWCLFYFLKKSEWNKNYLTKNYYNLYNTYQNLINKHWTCESLIEKGKRWSLDFLLNDKIASIVVKEELLFQLLLMYRTLIPKLHLLIGIGNYVASSAYN